VRGGLSFCVARAAGEIAVEAVENLHRCFAVAGAERRRDPLATRSLRSVRGLAVLLFTQAELAQDIVVRNAFSASQRSAGTVECDRCFRRDLFFFRGAEASECDSGPVITGSMWTTAASWPASS
jgi:hypothetical protein